MEKISKTLLAIFSHLEKSFLGFFILKSKGILPKGFPSDKPRSGAQKGLRLSSLQFGNNEMIPRKYTCDGENINPPLAIENVPIEAQSLTLIVHDPDAPAEGGWTHWIVFNIDPMITEIPEAKFPQGSIEGTTSFGHPGYGGPCPPSEIHHYEFSLYALDSRLLLDEDATKTEVEHSMEGHIIDKYTLVGLYGRGK